jgi:hypothetical protein
MACHGINKLTPHGTFLNHGHIHKKFICECGARWQHDGKKYYQNRTKSDDPREVHSFRATKEQIKKMVKKFGSIQQTWDSLNE